MPLPQCGLLRPVQGCFPARPTDRGQKRGLIVGAALAHGAICQTGRRVRIDPLFARLCDPQNCGQRKHLCALHSALHGLRLAGHINIFLRHPISRSSWTEILAMVCPDSYLLDNCQRPKNTHFSQKGFCRKLRLCMGSLLSLDTVIQRVRQIAGKRIGRTARIVVCGSCARLRCHSV